MVLALEDAFEDLGILGGLSMEDGSCVVLVLVPIGLTGPVALLTR